jgi:hypothetical protein
MNFWEYLDARAARNAARKLDPRLFANIIGGSVVGSFVGSIPALFFIPMPTVNEQLITYMIGQLSGFAGGVIAYHYASKAGEHALDAKRADNTGKALEAVTAAIQATPALADVDVPATGKSDDPVHTIVEETR